MSIDPRILLGGHVTGSLNKSESRRLTDAALDDQDIFDELLDLDPLRGVLADAQFRYRLMAELRERVAREGTPVAERLRRLFFRPMVIPTLMAAVTVLLVVLVRQGILHESSPVVQVALGPAGVPLLREAGILDSRAGEAERLREVQEQPVRKSASGSLAFDRTGDSPAYRIGDPIRIGFKAPTDSSIVIVEERPDGTVTRLFPNRFQSSSRVDAGQTIWVPPAGQGPLEVDGPTGPRTVRVLVFPPDVNPLDPDQPWAEIRQKASVLEKTYEVQP
jgi:hypothetical protein